jgi:DNA-binding response OmpR family regulator
MPNMNGLDLADRVLQSDSQLPVLFMSGDEQTTHRCCGCLAKPFRPTELVGRVGQALDASDKQRENAH